MNGIAPRVYSWIDFVSGRRTTIDSMIVRRAYRDVNPAGVPIVVGIPFSPRHSATVREAEAWLTEGATAQIEVFDLDGRLARVIRIAEPRRPVTNEDLSSYIRALAAGSSTERKRLEERYSRIPMPDSMPTFESLLVDELGLVWAGRYHWDPAAPREWTVFNGDGRALGSVTTPSHIEIEQIGADFILGIARDSFGVEHVERYGLRRGTVVPPALTARQR